MIVEAKHNSFVVGFFNIYAKIKIRKNFHQVVIKSDVGVSNHAVFLLSNHLSWWDGFWALYLNMHLFKKKFHFMMDEKELGKRWLFSFIGGFSVAPHSKSMFESIHYASELLKNRNNLVLIYPQGKLHSAYCRDIKFLKGINRIQVGEETKIIYLVQLTDYFQHEKPTVYFFLKEADKETLIDENYEAQYSAFFTSCINEHSKITV